MVRTLLKITLSLALLATGLAAQDATATGDHHKPQMIFGRMMQTCVACHAAYRLR